MNSYINNQNDNTMYGVFAIISSGGLLLSYSYHDCLKFGQFVCVPLRQGKSEKKVIGVFLHECSKPEFECRPIFHAMPYDLALKKNQLNLIQAVSNYYLTPLEWSMKLLAPGYFWNYEKFSTIIKYFSKLTDQSNSQNILSKFDLNQNQNQNQKTDEKIIVKDLLNFGQADIYNKILQNLNKTLLLHGVTGSGKTEIYLSVAQHILSLGKTCLVLVPEISLTPQMSKRFKKIFGEQLSVLHSGISPSALLKEWLQVYLGQKKIVLGVRSAVFCPLENIGLIIVDEEHDQSYKSSERPCYHARDVAVMRAKQEGACCLLGSATPSLESYVNAKNNKYLYLELKEKHAAQTKVDTLIFETKKNQSKFKLVRFDQKECYIEKEILELIKKNHENNFQTIVLLNRRGFVNYALCESCRAPLSCPNCSVATTIHNFGKREICHYCDFNQEIRKSCPGCGVDQFLLRGVGTQNIESYLKNEISGLRVQRLDRDTLTSHKRLTEILKSYENHETDCLVGTQILAKGHDFPNTTLIVILNVEDGLFLPDFRAAEKTFHLLTQSMGRVGRGKFNGTVALQSMVKRHPVIDLALTAQIDTFLAKEIKNRERAFLPPFSRFILIELKHKNKIIIEKQAQFIKQTCIEHWKAKQFDFKDVCILGPYDAPIEKINHIYRLHLCIHTSKTLHPHHCVPQSIYSSFELKQMIKIDVDPQNFM